MMRRESRARWIGVVLLLLMLALPGSLVRDLSKPAAAAPSITNLGNGNKTISWDFTNQSDYAASGVNVSRPVQLNMTGGSLLQDSDQDLATNGTWDTTNLSVSGGSLASRQFRQELVVNGSFEDSEPWLYQNSSDGNVSALRDDGNQTGEFRHSKGNSSMIQFDSMDTGVGANWTYPVMGPRMPLPTVNAFNQDVVTKHEGTASVMLDINYRNRPENWVLLLQDLMPSQNWSDYNTLGVWLNTTYPGPDILQVGLDLTSIPGPVHQNLTKQTVTQGWRQYLFNLSQFAGNLGQVIRIAFNFTNISGTAAIWVDDVWLYHFDRIDQSAGMSQEFAKKYFTDRFRDPVSFSFMYRVDSSASVTDASLIAAINDTLWRSFPPINVTRDTNWTRSPIYNLGGALTGKGMFNLSFFLHLWINTPFAASLIVQIDNVTMTVPEYHGGNYTSIPFDLGRSVFFDNMTWDGSSHPDTNITVDVRSGWSNDTADGSWSSWEIHVNRQGYLLNNSTGGFLQYRVILTTANASAPASFDWVNFTFHRYLDAGSIETMDFTPSFVPPEQLIGWRRFHANLTALPSTTTWFDISNDSGANWTRIPSGSFLDFLGGSTIRLRAELLTSNTTITPRLFDFNVTYEFLGLLTRISVSPTSWAGTADQSVQFAARGYDAYGHIVQFTPMWTTNDPRGLISPTGLYEPGMAGMWVVCASSGSVTTCANVTVSPGAIARMSVTPTPVSVEISELQNFTAAGEDSDGNSVSLTATRWTTDVGSFEGAGNTWGLFRAKGEPGAGVVTATNGTKSDSASVTVTPSTSLRINGIVPDQNVNEDDPDWALNLNQYLPTSLNSNDLMWYFEGMNSSLYSVYGERRFGGHTLVFHLEKDAHGSNMVTLFLENRNGGRTSQSLWVRVAPVNDGPVFYDVPDISVGVNSPCEFDYTPYLYDVDTPKSELLLTTYDASHAVAHGLVVNYTYDQSYEGQTIYIRLRISDGQFSDETIQIIKVTDDPGPHPIKPLPEVVMNEDEVKDDAFPEPLSAYFRDPDGETLSFSCVSAVHLKVECWTNATGAHVRITPERDWFGLEYIRVRASDPSAFAEQNVRVTVNPVNDPPVLGWHEDVYVRHDLPYDLDLTDYVSDIDNPLTDLTLSTDRPGIAPVDGFIIHFFVQGNVYGNVTSFPLSISLSDGLAAVSSDITLHVGNDDPPMLVRSLPDVSFNEDESAQWTFDLNDYFIDPDGLPQPLSFTVQNGTVSVTVEPVGAHEYVDFSAPLNWNGQEVVHIIASDGQGFAVGRLTVRVIPVDDPPYIDPIPDQDLGTGGTRAIDLRLYIHDVDNNITELLISTNSPHAVVYGYILILDYRGGAGSETVTITANDTQKQSQPRSFNVKVNPVTVEEKPNLLAQILWPWSLLLLLLIPAIFAAMYTRALDKRYTVEDVFMVGKEGRLIMHNTRHLRADRDEDIIAGMLTAIMAFIKDSFREDGEDLKAFEFGDKKVLIERGAHFYLAGIYAGDAPETAPGSLREFVQDVEEQFGPILERWSGDADDIRGLKVFMDAFVAHRSYRRGDWKKYSPKKGRAA